LQLVMTWILKLGGASIYPLNPLVAGCILLELSSTIQRLVRPVTPALPLEIVSLILSHLQPSTACPHPQDLGDLHRRALVNSAWSFPARRFIFATVQILGEQQAAAFARDTEATTASCVRYLVAGTHARVPWIYPTPLPSDAWSLLFRATTGVTGLEISRPALFRWEDLVILKSTSC
jgi:hypothetical protein